MERKTVLGWLDSKQAGNGNNGNSPITKAREDDPHHASDWQDTSTTDVADWNGPLTEARRDDPETAARLDDPETRAREDD